MRPQSQAANAPRRCSRVCSCSGSCPLPSPSYCTSSGICSLRLLLISHSRGGPSPSHVQHTTSHAHARTGGCSVCEQHPRSDADRQPQPGASLTRAPPTERERQCGECKALSPPRAPATERERPRCAVRAEGTVPGQVIVAIVAVVAVSRSFFFCSPSRTQQDAQAKRRRGVPGEGRRANSQSQTCALRGHAPGHRGLALSLQVQVRRVRQAGGTPQVEQERQCEASQENGRSTQPPHALPTERERQDGGDKAAPSEHAAQCNAAAAFLAFFVAGTWSTMP